MPQTAKAPSIPVSFGIAPKEMPKQVVIQKNYLEADIQKFPNSPRVPLPEAPRGIPGVKIPAPARFPTKESTDQIKVTPIQQTESKPIPSVPPAKIPQPSYGKSSSEAMSSFVKSSIGTQPPLPQKISAGNQSLPNLPQKNLNEQGPLAKPIIRKDYSENDLIPKAPTPAISSKIPAPVPSPKIQAPPQTPTPQVPVPPKKN